MSMAHSTQNTRCICQTLPRRSSMTNFGKNFGRESNLSLANPSTNTELYRHRHSTNSFKSHLHSSQLEKSSSLDRLNGMSKQDETCLNVPVNKSNGIKITNIEDEKSPVSKSLMDSPHKLSVLSQSFISLTDTSPSKMQNDCSNRLSESSSLVLSSTSSGRDQSMGLVDDSKVDHLKVDGFEESPLQILRRVRKK